MSFRKMQEINLANKRVLIRADLNVPIAQGKISDDTRIRACIPTLQHALKAGAGVIVMSHLGRPTEGEFKPEDSLVLVAEHLSILLGQKVKVISDWKNYKVSIGDLVLLENVRCNKGEKKNLDALGQQYAALCDVFLNDAFATAHRAEASTHAVAKFAKEVGAGLLMEAELDALGKALKAPARPLLAIVAGSKVSTKLTILESLADKVDHLIVGGGIANTFLLAEGWKIGKSLAEPDLVNSALAVISKLHTHGGKVPLPTDVVVGKQCNAQEPAVIKPLAAVTDEDMILDIGPDSAAHLAQMIQSARTIVWNGPVGVFELDQFGKGTETLARAIANSPAFSIAGGGDTVAAIAKYGITDQVDYISTGGGAFLEFLEGKVLPAVEILERRAHP